MLKLKHTPSRKMLFVLLILSQAYLGDFKCDICVTQPLLTSNVKCPICTTLDGQRKSEGNLTEELESDYEGTLFSEEGNLQNWTTCNINTPPCNVSYRYRSFDGSCNNLEKPTWGMTNTAYTRLLPSHYRDGEHLVRLDADGNDLPLVRKLSTTFFPDGNQPDSITLMVMQWGQVVAHDIALTFPLDPWDCCNPDTNNEKKCLSFIYSPDDYFYSKHNITCENFQRNQFTHVGNNCQGGPAQQINRVSHLIDGSLIYGSDLATSNSLRTFIGGRLKTRKLDDGREFLPNVEQDQVTSKCYALNNQEPCYVAGDVRVNQSPQLSALSNVILRTHNSIANALHEIHRTWDDEKLFQETRRILVAILQHVHYKEWLKFYVGEEAMKTYQLYPKIRGYTKYYSEINLIGINSFGAGAFRVGHSGIQGLLNMYNHDHQLNGSVHLSDWMLRPLIVEKGCNYDKFLLGLVNQPMQKFDTLVTNETTNLLLHGFKPYGSDLVSLDILRARDHGLAPYVHYLEICSGFKATTFENLTQFMSEESVSLLSKNYKAVEDIDLLVGGTLENHVGDSRLGKTFLCIFIEQFYRLKWGDRFWYEVKGQPHSFTLEQLKEIRKMTVSKLICYNSDRIQRMPLNSFLPISSSNKIEDCDKIPGIDLSKF